MLALLTGLPSPVLGPEAPGRDSTGGDAATLETGAVVMTVVLGVVLGAKVFAALSCELPPGSGEEGCCLARAVVSRTI